MPRPNILFIQTDQLRYDAMGCAGHPDVLTPNLDALAVSGTRFSHHFVQNPVCMPSRVSMLTGRYPSNLQITKMGAPVPVSTPTLATMLGAAGYRTACIGKLHFLPHSNRDHRQPHPAYGFDHLMVSDEPGPYDDAYRAWVRRTRPDQLDAISAHVDPPASKLWRTQTGFKDGILHPEQWAPWTTVPFAGVDDVTHSAFVGTQCMELINQLRGSSWFTIASFYSPHSPLVAPQRFLDLYAPDKLTLPQMPDEVWRQLAAQGIDKPFLLQARQGYYAMISEVDHWVGQIIDTLKSSGQYDNTVIVFTSDHGEYLGEFEKWGKSYPAPDCVSRVPLLIRSPEGKPDHVCDQLVEAVDILPTLLQLAGVPVPGTVDGQSLVQALNDDAYQGRPGVIMEDSQHAVPWRSWRTPTHRYILMADGNEQLYDLTQPLGEYHNQADEPAMREVLLKNRLALATKLISSQYSAPVQWAY